MRKVVSVLGVLLMALSGGTVSGQELEGTISLSGAWALYPMAVRWGEEFKKIHPKVNFDISAGGAGKGITDALAGAVDLGMVSREISDLEIQKGAFPIAVTKDAVVPVVSAANPVLADIRKKGLKRDAFIGIWLSKDVATWGHALGTADTTPIHVYTRSDACGAAETWAKYLGKKQEDLVGIGVYGDPGLGEAARRDPLAIGYNNINFAYDAKTQQPVEGLAIVPIDVNGNGQLDPNEDFYASRKGLVEAIGRGDYPSPPARDLYFVSKGVPEKPLTREFIRWVLTDGQQFVDETGYLKLTGDKLTAGLKKLGATP